MMSREATNLAADLPNYSATLSEKITVAAQHHERVERAEKGGRRADRPATAAQRADQRAPPAPSVGTPAQKPDDKPIPVEITTPEPTGWGLYQTIVGTLLPPLATAGIVLLFVIFILLQREDLRDRLIRLFGGSDLQRATSTMTDAATRLSRYFLSQVLINFAYGALIAVRAVADRRAEPDRLGHPRRADALRALCRRAISPPRCLLLIAAAIDPGWTTFV